MLFFYTKNLLYLYSSYGCPQLCNISIGKCKSFWSSFISNYLMQKRIIIGSSVLRKMVKHTQSYHPILDTYIKDTVFYMQTLNSESIIKLKIWIKNTCRIFVYFFINQRIIIVLTTFSPGTISFVHENSSDVF